MISKIFIIIVKTLTCTNTHLHGRQNGKYHYKKSISSHTLPCSYTLYGNTIISLKHLPRKSKLGSDIHTPGHIEYLHTKFHRRTTSNKKDKKYRDFGVDLSRHARTDTRTHGRVHARTYARTLIHHTVSISGLTACSYVHMRVICVCSTLCIVTAMRYGAALELLRVAVPT